MARVQVPFEALRRTTRERKYILEEIESLLKRVQPGQSGTSSIAEQVGTLNTLVEQLQSLKCKVGSAWAENTPLDWACPNLLQESASVSWHGILLQNHHLEMNPKEEVEPQKLRK